MKLWSLVIQLYILIMGCNACQVNDRMVDDTTVNGQSHRHQLPFLDTIIKISNGNSPQAGDSAINGIEAEKLLYDYFKNKGILTLKESQTSSTIDRIEAVEYDTIYNIWSTNVSGALLLYWLGPTDLNGRCFQPRKALIIKTNTGYEITSEDFIPASFAIDSISGADIYGYDYECGGDRVLRQFKVALR